MFDPFYTTHCGLPKPCNFHEGNLINLHYPPLRQGLHPWGRHPAEHRGQNQTTQLDRVGLGHCTKFQICKCFVEKSSTIKDDQRCMYVVSRNSINTTKRWPCVSFYGRCDKRRNACHILSPRCRPPTVAGVLGGQSYLQGTNVVDAPFLRLQAFDGTRGKTTSMLVWRGPGLWSRS